MTEVDPKIAEAVQALADAHEDLARLQRRRERVHKEDAELQDAVTDATYKVRNTRQALDDKLRKQARS